MAEPIAPTRSELLKVKQRIKLSQLGYKLLKMKRDGLMYELFEILPKVKGIRANLVKNYQECLRRMNIAQSFEGVIEIKSIAYTRKTPPSLRMGRKNVMGVVVPTVEADKVRRALADRGYGVIGTSSLIDEAVDSYEALVDEIIRAAELETTLKRLLDEIEKTKRRVNALEFKVIPEQTAMRDFISLRLEEIERENLFRLKKIKAKSEKKEEEAAAAEASSASANGARRRKAATADVEVEVAP